MIDFVNFIELQTWLRFKGRKRADGLSGNCSYNPAQSTNYMRNGIRDWSSWLKVQTGVDGFRLDAAKHFEPWATQDFLWNLAYNAQFASGGSHMYAVGEYVGSASDMDGWVADVNSSNGGGFDLVGMSNPARSPHGQILWLDACYRNRAFA